MSITINNQTLPRNYNSEGASSNNVSDNVKANANNVVDLENPAYMINLSPEAQKIIRDSAKQNGSDQNTTMSDFIDSINKRANLINKESSPTGGKIIATKFQNDILV